MSIGPGPNESFASLFEQSAGATARHRRYHTGESVEVSIVAVTRDAVFADLGGKQEGVFERAELADPEGNVRVEIGSRVTAVVTGVDSSTGQVRLSPKVIRTATEGDVGVARASGPTGPVLTAGTRIKGAVTGIERYGVFVQITGTQGRSGRGLIPSAETATPRGADLKKHFTVGQELEAKILNIDETGKIRLSISALSVDEERGAFEAFKSSQEGTPADGEAQASDSSKKPSAPRNAKPTPRNFGTLGDLLPKGISPAAKTEPTPKLQVSKPAASPAAQGRDSNVPAGRRVAVKRTKG
jgi:small subunit ribosomal protein S1